MIVKLPATGGGFLYVNREQILYMKGSPDGTAIFLVGMTASPSAFLFSSLSLDDATDALNAPSVSVSLSSIPELTVDTTTTGTIS